MGLSKHQASGRIAGVFTDRLSSAELAWLKAQVKQKREAKQAQKDKKVKDA